MARISYDTENQSGVLRRTLAGYLTHAIEAFPVAPEAIREMVVVGNSTMRDLFFRLNVYSIGQNPYRSITEIEMADGKRTSTALGTTGRQALLPIDRDAGSRLQASALLLAQGCWSSDAPGGAVARCHRNALSVRSIRGPSPVAVWV